MIVICFIIQYMKRSKDGLFVFPPKKTLIWRNHCSIDQSCCSMTSKPSIDWFLESSSGLKFFRRAFARLYPFDKPIKSLYLRPFLFFLFCWCVFISRSYENRSKALKRYNKSNSEGVGVKRGPMSGGLVNIIGFLFFVVCRNSQTPLIRTLMGP